MRRLLARVPDYSCIETVTRSLSSSDLDEPRESEDRMRVEVALVEGRERYSWPGTDSFEATSLAELAGYGVSSSGEFGPHARGMFLSTESLIRPMDEGANGGDGTRRFEYQVPEEASTYWLERSGLRTRVGYHGTFLADRDTNEVVQLEIRADDPSGASGFLSTSAVIDLVRAGIGGVETLLPTRAVVKARTTDGVKSENTHVYSECRVFRAESTISFDVRTRSHDTAAGRAESAIAAGIELRIESTGPFRSEELAAGDTFDAVLTHDVYVGSELVASKGAPMRGRIRQVEWLLFPGSRAMISLELTGVETISGTVANIYATLERIDRAPPMQRLTTVESFAAPTRDVQFARYFDLVRPQLPGFGSFYVLGRRFEVRPGMRMMWRTIPPPAVK